LKLSRNKITDVLIEYGCEYAPGAVPIDLTSKPGGRAKKESVVKRPFKEQPSDAFRDIPGAPQSSSEPKKARITLTSQLLDSHHAEVQA
jgi:hypothetical protein